MISRSIPGAWLAIAMLFSPASLSAETVPGGIAKLSITSIEKPVATY